MASRRRWRCIYSTSPRRARCSSSLSFGPRAPPTRPLNSLAATPNANTTTLSAANWASLTTLDSGYCVYEGSATTPDCEKNVVWLVQRQLMTATAAQIARVRTTFKFVADFRGNWRTTQPLRGRSVVCFDAESGGCSLPLPSPYGLGLHTTPVLGGRLGRATDKTPY